MGKPVWDEHHHSWVDAEGGFAIPAAAVLHTTGPWWYVDQWNHRYRMTKDDGGEWQATDRYGVGTLFDADNDGNAAGYSMPIPRCDCGALKARTPHADWCSTQGGAA